MLGVGYVRLAGQIRPAEWKRPVPKRFLSFNGPGPPRIKMTGPGVK